MARRSLPRILRPLFWDSDPAWPQHRNFIIKRVLSNAAPASEAVDWIRAHVGDDYIYDLIVTTKARGLVWQNVARWVSRRHYDQWIAEDPNRRLWDARV